MGEGIISFAPTAKVCSGRLTDGGSRQQLTDRCQVKRLARVCVNVSVSGLISGLCAAPTWELPGINVGEPLVLCTLSAWAIRGKHLPSIHHHHHRVQHIIYWNTILEPALYFHSKNEQLSSGESSGSHLLELRILFKTTRG